VTTKTENNSKLYLLLSHSNG